ncbi:MAG: ATP-binding protein [Pseudomonadota bacterium]
MRKIDQRLAPGLGAAALGFAGNAIWSDPLMTIMSAVVGATVMALIFAKSEADQPVPLVAEEVEEADAEPFEEIVPAGLAPGQGRALLERLPMGVILIDGRGLIQFANEQAGELFGRKLITEQHGSSLRIPKLVEAIDLGVSEGISSTLQFSLAREPEVWLRAHILSLGGEDLPERETPTVLVVIEDVTQNHLAAAVHRDFVANASHELKTPLSSIAGIIETLQGHARGDAAATERFVDMMASQTDRMKRLVEDLLSLNRIELNERIAPRETQPIRRIVWETADALLPVAEDHGVALDVAAASDLPHVRGNREELAQVFSNLIENAIKYGGEGTTVTIVVEPEDAARPDMIGISVTDRGPGIAREHIPRLTERFYRVSISRSRERGGTGLGLAIVKHIVNRHRGELEIESELGDGSKFIVWLPVTRVEEVDEDRSADAA